MPPRKQWGMDKIWAGHWRGTLCKIRIQIAWIADAVIAAPVTSLSRRLWTFTSHSFAVEGAGSPGRSRPSIACSKSIFRLRYR